MHILRTGRADLVIFYGNAEHLSIIFINMATEKFNGWVGKDAAAADGNLIYEEFQPKRWEETDVDIEVTHCGMCGSDMHTLSGGWHKPTYPYVVGHEIVGRVVRVGSKVSHVKVGDRVGVGAQSDACLECDLCKNGNETYCDHFVQTYDGIHKNGDRSMGGYADNARVPGSFVINLNPYSNIPSEILAPMLCGGATMFSPLKRYGAGPGKKVGIIGLGGLGHFGVMFAKALGSDEVVVISRSKSKEADALKLGADRIIATGDEPDWAKKYGSSLDLIVNTADSPNMPLTDYLGLLAPMGTLVQVGAPEGNMPGFNGFKLLSKNRNLTGTAIGSRGEIREMLQLANDRGVKTWANPFPMSKVNDAIKAFHRSEGRYRIVLVNEKNASANL
ncbi:NADP-dependent alcohol dehydrogenase [Drechslerella dactyloides]|uniref:alcohol dehydrogenase (NADP(+)) n=1 Tax=Drechslerella dactyloides TaxID=74499 RepID=A0AAD6IV50_DREDA|nr:NADP-dependent alcohol dehydrogenase [Drechslerella dactyloides]